MVLPEVGEGKTGEGSKAETPGADPREGVLGRGCGAFTRALSGTTREASLAAGLQYAR